MPFLTSKFMPNDFRTTIITITSYNDWVPVGTIRNPNFAGDIPFHGLTELLLNVDLMLDEMESPMAATETRSFVANTTLPTLRQVVKPTEFIASFKLIVLFRQNSSWQGNLAWVEDASEAPFRSVFELVCLMHSALTGNAATKQQAEPKNSEVLPNAQNL